MATPAACPGRSPRIVAAHPESPADGDIATTGLAYGSRAIATPEMNGSGTIATTARRAARSIATTAPARGSAIATGALAEGSRSDACGRGGRRRL